SAVDQRFTKAYVHHLIRADAHPPNVSLHGATVCPLIATTS
ncbi:MAG: hypothetical protein RI971_849, partial [Chloroflexota bacterium]